MFDLNDLRFFLAVVQTGSLSAASRKLGVTQPTVGRRIQALETALDARLFDRMQSGFTLTEAGQDILSAAKNIEENAWTIFNQVTGEENKLSGKVRITTSEGLANFWIMEKLNSFQAENPDIKLEVQGGIGLADMLRREADVALRIGKPGTDELIGKCLGQVGFGLYASNDYLERHGVPKSLSELNGHQIVDSSGDLGNTVQALRLREMVEESNVNLFTNNIVTQSQAVINGVGITSLPMYVAAKLPTLKRILAEEFDIRSDIWLLTHRDFRYTTKIKAVMAFLKQEVMNDKVILT